MEAGADGPPGELRPSEMARSPEATSVCTLCARVRTDWGLPHADPRRSVPSPFAWIYGPSAASNTKAPPPTLLLTVGEYLKGAIKPLDGELGRVQLVLFQYLKGAIKPLRVRGYP